MGISHCQSRSRFHVILDRYVALPAAAAALAAVVVSIVLVVLLALLTQLSGGQTSIYFC